MAVVQRSGAVRDATATFQHNQWISNVAALEQVRTSHKKHSFLTSTNSKIQIIQPTAKGLHLEANY